MVKVGGDVEVLVGGKQVEKISLPSIPRRVREQVSNMGETVTEGREGERWEGGGRRKEGGGRRGERGRRGEGGREEGGRKGGGREEGEGGRVRGWREGGREGAEEKVVKFAQVGGILAYC